MKLSRRRNFLHLAAGAVALSALPRASQKRKPYPTPAGADLIVAARPPGGATDVVARLIGSAAVGAARPAIHRRQSTGTPAVISAPKAVVQAS